MPPLSPLYRLFWVLQPHYGTVPGYVGIDGHIPVSEDPDWANFFSIAPMCRYAEDLPLYMRSISDPEKRDFLRLDEPVMTYLGQIVVEDE